MKVLIPMNEIPANEKWIWENQDALAALQQGLAEAEAGNLVSDPTIEDEDWEKES